MAIAFQCGCGKSYRVKPELAGKRVKCTACGKVLEVPPLEPQLEDLKSLADPFAALAPLGGGPEYVAEGHAGSLASPLGGPILGGAPVKVPDGQSAGRVPLWVWIAGGGGTAGVVALAAVVAVAMSANTSHQTVNSAPIVVSPPRAPPVPASSAIASGLPPPPPALAAGEQRIDPTREKTEQDGWVPYHSAEGGYSIAFPSSPQHRRDERDTPQGKVTLNTDASISPTSGVFAVTCANYPDGPKNPKRDIAQEARNASAGAADGAHGKIIATRNVPMQGVASQVYVIESVVNGRTLQIHIVFVFTRDRMYNIAWTGLKEAISEADITRFMTSFKADSG